jgi:hypothetical protein
MFASAFGRKSKCFQMDDPFGVPARCESLQARRGRHEFFIPPLSQGLLPCTRLDVGYRISDHPPVVSILSHLIGPHTPSPISPLHLPLRDDVPRIGAPKIPFTQRTILSGNNTKGLSLTENNIKSYSFTSCTTSLTILILGGVLS